MMKFRRTPSEGNLWEFTLLWPLLTNLLPFRTCFRSDRNLNIILTLTDDKIDIIFYQMISCQLDMASDCSFWHARILFLFLELSSSNFQFRQTGLPSKPYTPQSFFGGLFDLRASTLFPLLKPSIHH